eukprot:Skav226893  [mRNA]  locus=scaffold2258:29626:34587:- [translate_table: standard]
MDLVNGGDLDAALGLLNGPGVDANGEIQLPPGVEPGSKEYNEFLQQLEAQGLIEIREEPIASRCTGAGRKKQIQERLIEVPKVDWVERVEYEDYVEYREVPVDKIIEASGPCLCGVLRCVATCETRGIFIARVMKTRPTQGFRESQQDRFLWGAGIHMYTFKIYLKHIYTFLFESYLSIDGSLFLSPSRPVFSQIYSSIAVS